MKIRSVKVDNRRKAFEVTAANKNAEGRRTTVPFHAGKILHPQLLGAILKDAGLTVERFQELMRQPSSRRACRGAARDQST